MKLCIIIPVHNEALTIGGIVKELCGKGLDVVVINDGSADASEAIALQNGATALANEGRQGKGASLKKGFDFAAQRGYEAVITMDGDGQHHVDDVAAFTALADFHPLAVITGNRMDNCKGMPWIRCLTNRVMSRLISMAAKRHIPDTQCGFRYISCRILKEINLVSRDFEIETEILIKAAKKGFEIYSVPIRTIYRNEVSKIHPVADTIRFVIYFFKEFFQK